MLVQNSSISLQTTFSVQPVGSNGVTVIYNTLPGNNPSKYGNQVAVWQNGNFIPWGTQPIAFAVPSGPTPYGSVFLPFTIGVGQSYIVAYQVGFSVGSACATLFLPSGGNPDPCVASSLGLVGSPETNNITVSYTLPFGARPQNYRHWVGVWEGALLPYSTAGMVAQAMVTSDNSSDTQNIPLASPLSANTTYTVAYFAGPQPSNMAMTCTFTTGS